MLPDCWSLQSSRGLRWQSNKHITGQERVSVTRAMKEKCMASPQSIMAKGGCAPQPGKVEVVPPVTENSAEMFSSLRPSLPPSGSLVSSTPPYFYCY